MPDWLSSMVVIVSYLFLLSLFFKFLIPVLARQIDIIVNLDVELLMGEFNGPITALESWFKEMNINGMNREAIKEQLVGLVNFDRVSTL